MFLDYTNKNQHILGPHDMLAAVLNSFHGFPHLTLAISPGGRYLHYPHLVDEETETQEILNWPRLMHCDPKTQVKI